MDFVWDYAFPIVIAHRVVATVFSCSFGSRELMAARIRHEFGCCDDMGKGRGMGMGVDMNEYELPARHDVTARKVTNCKSNVQSYCIHDLDIK